MTEFVLRVKYPFKSCFKMRVKCTLEEGNEHVDHDDVLNEKVHSLQEGGQESSRDTGFGFSTGCQRHKT